MKWKCKIGGDPWTWSGGSSIIVDLHKWINVQNKVYAKFDDVVIKLIHLLRPRSVK